MERPLEWLLQPRQRLVVLGLLFVGKRGNALLGESDESSAQAPGDRIAPVTYPPLKGVGFVTHAVPLARGSFMRPARSLHRRVTAFASCWAFGAKLGGN